MDDGDWFDRRAYLALVGAGVAGLAGCQSDAAESPADTHTGSTGAPRATATAPPTAADEPTATDDGPPTTATERTPATTDDAPAPTERETATPKVDDAVAEAESSLAELSFEGTWFDTHAHWRMGDVFGYDDYATDALTARQREHDVGATVLFVPREPFASDYPAAVETLAREEVDYLPFFFPGGFSSGEKRRSYYDDNETIYHGIGEVTFYSGTEQGMALTDDPFPEYFRLSADEGLVLMIHPTRQQAGDIGPMLSRFPDATLLLHGFEMLGTGDTLLDLLRGHDNLYWTYDTATMLGGLMVTASGKSDFIERFESRRERYLDRVTRRLPALLEAAPDRVMWGTDVVADWHVDPDVYRRLISFSGDVVDALPAKHRDAYAHGNAVALFES